LRDIFTIYANTDPTGLEDRIKNVISRPDISLLTGGAIGLALALVAAITGICLIIAGILALCGLITSEFGMAFLLSGIALLISGIIGISTNSINIHTYNTNKGIHKTQNTNILNDIRTFNGNRTHV